MDNAGPDGAIFFSNIVGCCNFIEPKSREVSTVYWTRGYFSKPNDVCNKMLHLALECVKN